MAGSKSRRGHKGDPNCEFTSKAACEKARRIAIGQCVSMIDEGHQCGHWGIDRVDDRAYCGQHLNSVYLAADNARREAARKEAMSRRIDEALAWHASHPSVWDRLTPEVISQAAG